jgi:hypothetical protein
MNKPVKNLIVPIIMTALLAVTAGAQDHKKNQQIRQATVDSHELTYELIDMRQAMKEHGGHGTDTATHHLMVHITDPKGNPAADARVGFLIEGPEGAEQKVMAMGMGSGYGADISLNPAGKYTIKTKAVSEDQTLIDSFVYKAD